MAFMLGCGQANRYYPTGTHTSEDTSADRLIYARYDGKPIAIYLPAGEGPFPTVIFEHGRPFTTSFNYPYYPTPQLVNTTIGHGYALAIPIRSGYFGDSGTNREQIPCNGPTYADFVRAGEGAAEDVEDAVNYVSSLPYVDNNKLILAGTSAGGFAAINGLSKVDDRVRAVISINGGRCGSRGESIGGLANIAELYKKYAAEASTPIYFLTGNNDDVIPTHSTKTLYNAVCSTRNDCGRRGTTYLVQEARGNHNVPSMMAPYKRTLERIRF